VKPKQHANPISQPEGKRQGGLQKNGKRQKTTAVCCHKLIYPKKYSLFYQKLLFHYQKKTN